jgi:hypothetical protein
VSQPPPGLALGTVRAWKALGCVCRAFPLQNIGQVPSRVEAALGP